MVVVVGEEDVEGDAEGDERQLLRWMIRHQDPLGVGKTQIKLKLKQAVQMSLLWLCCLLCLSCWHLELLGKDRLFFFRIVLS